MKSRILALYLILGLMAAPAVAQSGAPTGFANVDWGSDESGLLAEFGDKLARDVHKLTWRGLLLLGHDASVAAWVDPDFGLVRGVYGFEFTGLRNQDARFDACDDVLEQAREVLYGEYGEGASSATGCGDGYYESWDWGNVTVEILSTYSSEAVGFAVMYRNHELEQKMGEADNSRRF